MLAVPLWVAVLLGASSLNLSVSPVLWHAHEMLFGFAVAVIVGFLLTAGKAWTGLDTPRGGALAALALLWLAARLAALVAPYAVYAALDLLLLPLVAAILVTRAAARRQPAQPAARRHPGAAGAGQPGVSRGGARPARHRAGPCAARRPGADRDDRVRDRGARDTGVHDVGAARYEAAGAGVGWSSHPGESTAVALAAWVLLPPGAVNGRRSRRGCRAARCALVAVAAAGARGDARSCGCCTWPMPGCRSACCCWPGPRSAAVGASAGRPRPGRRGHRRAHHRHDHAHGARPHRPAVAGLPARGGGLCCWWPARPWRAW